MALSAETTRSTRLKHLQSIFSPQSVDHSASFASYNNQSFGGETKLFKRSEHRFDSLIRKAHHLEQLDALRGQIAKQKEEIALLQEEKEDLERSSEQKLLNQSNAISLLKEELAAKKKIISTFDVYMKSFLMTLNSIKKQVMGHSITDTNQFQSSITQMLDDTLEKFQRMPSIGLEMDLLKILAKEEMQWQRITRQHEETMKLKRSNSTRTVKFTSNDLSSHSLGRMKPLSSYMEGSNMLPRGKRLLKKKAIIILSKKGEMPSLN